MSPPEIEFNDFEKQPETDNGSSAVIVFWWTENKKIWSGIVSQRGENNTCADDYDCLNSVSLLYEAISKHRGQVNTCEITSFTIKLIFGQCWIFLTTPHLRWAGTGGGTTGAANVHWCSVSIENWLSLAACSLPLSPSNLLLMCCKPLQFVFVQVND